MSDEVQRTRECIRARLFSTNPALDHEVESDVLSNESTPQSRRTAYSTIRGVLEHSIVQGYGSSQVVIGPSGCGKTWLVNEVLRDLNSDPKCHGNFVLVRLSGLVHVDNHQALLGIAAQLDLKDQLEQCVKMSFADSLRYILEALQKGSRAKKVIVVILEEFEKFVTHHKNQMLLYILSDAVLAKCTPVALVGLTACLESLEMLEKRVKSRFAARKVCLFLDYTFEEYVKVFRQLLSLPASFKNRDYRDEWDARVEELCRNTSIRQSLKQVFQDCPSIQRLKLFLTLPVSSLCHTHPVLEPADFAYCSQYFSKSRSSRTALLLSLSILELTLMIAAHHLSELSGYDSFNFEMVYSEYRKFTQRSASVKSFSKPVAMKAFEHLMDLELISPASGGFTHHQVGSRKTMKEHRHMMLKVEKHQITEAVKSFPCCPTEVSRWGLSQSIRR